MRTSTTTNRKNTRKTAAKIAASVVLVAGAASVAGLGTFGAFTSTTSASEQVAAGTITLGLGAASQPTSVQAAGLVPGDNVQRDLTLTRGATDEKFGSVSMTTTPKVGSLLTTDTANGLKLAVDQCSVPWTKATPAATNGALTCSGTTTSVLAASPVIGANRALPVALTSLNDAKTSYLRVTMTLPEAAGNDFQGKNATVDFTFDATQRAAESR
ncbi:MULTISPECIES: TasA family protein [unclassified Nocardioides]|uniref:TasA family protein n=1 Tax=unclassified Nocardioides TaxID=2615069 RepID=UPI0026664339|nr:TasA family protein [Nocardioides sp. Arc9.136]WKN50112.1 TasA family protein [Nocardioides sp. Arc9.136]